jgi:hypothetical protein
MRGGKRAGAGRPPGAATRRTREIADKAAEGGMTPLEFMLQILRDPSKPEDMRLDAAKSAAPYVHPRLTSVEAHISHDISNLDDDDLDRELERARSEAQGIGAAAGEDPP